MKNKFLLFVGAVVLLGVAWVVLANKFETAVQDKYLPLLKQQQELGMMEIDLDKIKIHKYSFEVTMDNVTIFPKYEAVKISFDQISVYLNPILESVLINSSGKVSFSSGDTQIYSKDPLALKLSRTLLDGSWDDVRLSVEGKSLELFSSADNSSVVVAQNYNSVLTGKFDGKTGLYSLKLSDNIKDIKLTAAYLSWSSNLLKKIYNVNNEYQNTFNQFIAGYYEAANIGEPVEYTGNSIVSLRKEKLKEIYTALLSGSKVMEGITSFASNFDVKKELFNILLSANYTSKVHNTNTVLDFSSDAKDVKGEIKFVTSSNYKKDEVEKARTFMAHFLAKIFNDLQIWSQKSNLTDVDFAKLSGYISDVKSFAVSANLLYKIESSDFDSKFKFAVDDHMMEIDSKGHNNKSYNGVLKLSDPIRLINAKAKFVHEVVLPFIEKVVDNSKVDIKKLKDFANNIENNGLEVLSVFNNSAKSDAFETSFSFDLEKFEAKINNKSLLSIITDDRIVKFLKGFEENSSVNKPVSAVQVPAGSTDVNGAAVLEKPTAEDRSTEKLAPSEKPVLEQTGVPNVENKTHTEQAPPQSLNNNANKAVEGAKASDSDSSEFDSLDEDN